MRYGPARRSVAACSWRWPSADPARDRSAQSALPPSESYLRLDWTAEPGKRGRPRVSGYVYNERDYWATGVQLAAEALDASGQVVGSSTTTVYGMVPPRNRSYFSIDVQPAASYRVTVRSVDWRAYGGGGG